MPNPSIQALNDEWRRLSVASRDRVRDWTTTHPEFGRCAGLDDVLIAIRDRPDAVLGVLLRLGESGDPLARRVVLQTMLGKAVTMARADRWHGVDDYLAELWLGIVTYPLVARPRSIAANLALDARKRLCRAEPAVPIDPEGLAALRLSSAPAEPSAELVLAEAEELGLIDGRTRLTLKVVYADGLRSEHAARLLCASPQAVRARCSRALRRLAGHAAALVPA